MMITDKATLEEELGTLNRTIENAIIQFKHNIDPSVTVEYFGTSIGLNYRVESNPVWDAHSRAKITINNISETVGVS